MCKAVCLLLTATVALMPQCPVKSRASEVWTALPRGIWEKENPNTDDEKKKLLSCHTVRSAMFIKMVWNQNSLRSSPTRNGEGLSRWLSQIRQSKSAKHKANGHESSNLGALTVSSRGNETSVGNHPPGLQHLTDGREPVDWDQSLLGSVISPPLTVPLEWHNGMTVFPTEDSTF